MVANSEMDEFNQGEERTMNEKYELAARAVEPELAAPIEDTSEVGLEQSDPYELQAEEYQEQQAKDAAIQDSRSRQLFSARTLLKTAWQPQSFLIGPRLLPKHGRMLITGTTGTGKSALALHLAASLATGSPMFGILNLHKGDEYQQAKFPIFGKSTVLYMDYEIPHNIRTLDRLTPLVKHFPEGQFREALLDNLFFAQHPTRYRLQNEKGEKPGEGSFDALRQLVANVQPNVVFFDPLSSTHSLLENGNEIKQAYNKADKLIDEYG